MTRIEKLNPEQEAKLPAYRDKWIKIGLSTEPTDLPRAKAAIKKVYEAAGLKPPKKILVADSPLHAAKMAAELDGAKDYKPYISHQIFGSHDAPWLAFYEFFLKECDLECVKPLEGLMELAQCCGWWAPYEDVAIIQHRHNVLHRDDQGRLHCEDGLAVGYPDGWGVYAWHGVRVQKWIIMEPHKITIDLINAEENAEVRRIMMERYGHGRYLEDSNAEIVHSSGNNILYRQEIPDDEPLVMVRVLNSTPEPTGEIKQYFLRVPPDIEDADEAVAWGLQLSREEYLSIDKET